MAALALAFVKVVADHADQAVSRAVDASERLAQQLVGGICHFVFRAAELHAAGLAAAAGVDLRLDDPQLAADFTRAREGGRDYAAVTYKDGTVELDNVTLWSIKPDAQPTWAAKRDALPKFAPVTLSTKKNAK